MRPTLRQLQYLVAIADTGRFHEAARRTHVSQPSLSAQIADLETELDATLIERGRHGAVMTPVGDELVRRARLILRDVEALRAAARQGEGDLAGRIRLGVIPTVGPYLLPNATTRLHAMFPDLRLNVQEHRTVDLDLQLQEGRLDTVISTANEHANCRSLPLFTEQLWICVAPDSVLAGQTGGISLKELKGASLLSLGQGHHLSLAIHELAKSAGAYVNSEYEGTSLDAIRQMSAMGAGVAILPSLYALLEARRDPDLVVRRIEHPRAQRDIALVWRNTSPMRQSFESLGSVLRDVAADLLAKAGG